MPRSRDGSVADEAPLPTTASRNACKVCAPLGACLAFRGIEGAIAFLHGSQGCSTYIRRYMISHFKEPIDIACSNFSEATTVFGGRENLRQGLENVIRQYDPKVVGIATTCLAETIGEDVAYHLREIRKTVAGPWPEIVHVGTPSYAGTHAEGFHAAIRAIVDTFAEGGPRENVVNLLPGIVSPADLRYLKSILRDFGVEPIVLSDYSDTLDGPTWSEYQRIPQGGTPLADIRRMGRAMATIEFGSTTDPAKTAGALLQERFGVPNFSLPQAIGVVQTDRFFDALTAITGRPSPAEHVDERGRLIDAYVDAHKYVFGKRAVVYGEQDLVAAMASFLMEIGIDPVLCGSGARTGKLRQRIEEFDSWSDQDSDRRRGRRFRRDGRPRGGDRARPDRGQQQGLRHVAEARRAAGPHRLSRPRSDRRAADAARRLSRGAATLRSHCQRRDRSRPGKHPPWVTTYM